MTTSGTDGHDARPAAPSAVPSTAQAVAASVACLRTRGLPADDAELVAEGYSVRVGFRGAGVVTRVVTEGQRLRPGPRPWLEREVAVATYLAAAGVPVVAPAADPGPHLAEGLDVSLWTRVEPEDRAVEPAVLGRMVGELHEALAAYPVDLPVLVGPLTDVGTAVATSSDPVLHRAASELVPLARSWPGRPLHGDVHTGNLLTTRDGVLWTDLEDVCRGPVEWDLASLTLGDDVRAAYPGRLDPVRLADCRDLRRLQVLASLEVGGVDDDALRRRLVGPLERRGR